MSSSASQSANALSGKLTPNLDENSTKTLNLTVLQRIDPSIEEILITAAHVTFYEFNIDLNQWSRKDVEGSLFVVKRNMQPRFQFIVMNRRNTENLVEDLLGDFEYEVQVPYLLYRNGSQQVNCIWFYNSHECEEIADLFSRILGAFSKVPPKPQVTSSKSEFEELEAVPTSGVIEGPLEPTITAATSTVQPEDSSFINFFNTAMKTGHGSSNYVNSRQLSHTEASTAPLSHVYGATMSHAPIVRVPPFPLTSPVVPPLTISDGSDPVSKNGSTANLVKPSSFYLPPSSTPVLAPPIFSSSSTSAPHPLLKHPHGAPVLQPFPPSSPPASLTTANSSHATDYGPVNREKLQDALLMLVQDNQFIDMVYQALRKAHER